ncbi:hypothetical protein [Derxia gummosa]|uniref:Uncharacterized protein n=1 Tax=Derxia gummosa DSM 723 TaxID=1121388 RepID=A0A8B6X0Z3_9BURK|nr:hypothetical protein [Derxia gummosa]
MSDSSAALPSPSCVRAALRLDGPAPPADLPPPPFALPTRHLAPPPEWCRTRFNASFEAEVARAPLDLHAHLRRIGFASHTDDDEQLQGAVADLFIALGSAGRALRARVLDEQRARLPATLVRLLDAHLDSGLAAGSLVPHITTAVLARPGANGAAFLRSSAPRS